MGNCLMDRCVASPALDARCISCDYMRPMRPFCCRRSEMERAKELYLEAIGVEADCVEAIFNLGLVNKQLGVYTEALQVLSCLNGGLRQFVGL